MARKKKQLASANDQTAAKAVQDAASGAPEQDRGSTSTAKAASSGGQQSDSAASTSHNAEKDCAATLRMLNQGSVDR